MNQNIPTFPCILDPLVGGLKGMRCVLGLAIIEVELEVDEVLWVGEVQVHPGAYCTDIILL